ncbi:MAG: MBL fold metallo-hydrolase, partial [Kiritimatiellia bacterium]
MKFTFLGTGTSSGVPAIGCRCAVCQSGDPRNKRRRSSLYVRTAGMHIIVDTPPDF